jgi:4-amino-4-deoxy-L-arabinose transferase-like glycosyltransferase
MTQLFRRLQFHNKLRKSEKSIVVVAAVIIALFGLTIRVALLFLTGNRQVSSFSGVGDQIRYLTLADSIMQGRGFSYAGQPTALRPPLYPLALVGSHMAFGSHYLVAMRVLQFVIGIVVAYLCVLLAERLFGVEAGAVAGAIAIGLPTLLLISIELQTEQFATFLVLLFLFCFLGEIQGKDHCALGMGITSGLAALVRSNCAILTIIGALACLWSRRSLKDALLVSCIAGLIVAPWLVRNAEVFHGKVLFSSHGGINLLEGVLTPDGRAQDGEDNRVRAAVGWLHTDIEQNNSHRLLFASEDQLERQARNAAIEAWKNLSWHSRLNLLATKIVTFWLSTDQLLDTRSFPPAQRVLRAAGVMIYWFVLALALYGWVSLFSSSRIVAFVIVFYMIAITLAHLPFVMNTRLRIPFVDPLLAVLAGGGFSLLIHKIRQGRDQSGERHLLNIAGTGHAPSTGH